MLRYLVIFVLWTASSFLRAQTGPDLSHMAGCTLQQRTYTCSKADLQHALALARTIKAVSQPPNHASDAALAGLVRRLGKTLATADTSADLTFLLEPLQEGGVQVGPGTVDLARLRVFIPSPDNPQGKLLWVQTYNGDASMGWPAIARATVAALRERIESR